MVRLASGLQKMLELPLRWKTPKRIFVNSTSDLFHEDVPTDYIKSVFDIMGRANWHQYQVLTKRSGRVLELKRQLEWAPHIWMGVSVENNKYKFRIDDLRETSAHVKFLSLEPLLGPLGKLNPRGCDWAIVGGESGPGARLVDAEWFDTIRGQRWPSRSPHGIQLGVTCSRRSRRPEGLAPSIGLQCNE